MKNITFNQHVSNRNKSLLRYFIPLLVLLLFVSGLYGQVIGDYGTNGSASWSTTSNWIVCTSSGTWAGATTASALPSSSTNANVWIRSGHTINVSSSPVYCLNLTIESGAKLWANVANTTGRYVRIYGTTFTNSGEFGGTNDGLGLGLYNANITLTGGGVYGINRIQPSIAGCTLTFDANALITYAGSSGAGGSSLYNNGFDNLTVNVNAGKTVTTSALSYIALGTSGSAIPVASGAFNFTLNINGTLTTGSSSHINLLNNTDASSNVKTSTITIGSTGVLNINGNLLMPAATSIGVLNIASGGKINFPSAVTFNLGAVTTTTVGGTFDCGLSTTRIMSGITTVNGNLNLTTGKIVLDANDLTISSSGTITGVGETSYIATNGAGKLIQNCPAATQKLFPIGTTTDYNPVSVTPTDETNIAVNVGTVLPAVAPSNYNYNAKVWDISSTMPSSTVLTLTPTTSLATSVTDVIGHYVGSEYVNVPATKAVNSYTATFSTFSPFVTGTTDLGTGISQNKINGVSFDGQTIHNSGNLELQVFDVTGRRILSSTKDIDMSGNSKGIYIVRSINGTLKISTLK